MDFARDIMFAGSSRSVRPLHGLCAQIVVVDTLPLLLIAVKIRNVLLEICDFSRPICSLLGFLDKGELMIGGARFSLASYIAS